MGPPIRYGDLFRALCLSFFFFLSLLSVLSLQTHCNLAENPSSSMASRDVKDADVASKITGRALDEFRKEYDIPSSVKLYAPNPHQRVNHEEPLRIAVHEEMLRIGIKLPFRGLVASFLAAFRITPGQMTPNSWRIIREISMWAEDNEIRISGEALLHLLTLKRSGDFVVVQGVGNSKVVSGMPTSNKGWKAGFFFIKRVDDRGKFVPWGVPYKWRDDLVLPTAGRLSAGDAEALEALKIAIGSQGLPYTPPQRGRERAANPPKRRRGSLKKASGEPLSVRPLQIRGPEERISPPRKRRKTAEAEAADEELEVALQESARAAAEPNREDEELQAALQESARLQEEGDPRPTDEQRLQIALTEAVEVGILQLSSEDEAAEGHPAPAPEGPQVPTPTEDEATEGHHAPAPEDPQVLAPSELAGAAEVAPPFVQCVDLEGTPSEAVVVPAPATGEAYTVQSPPMPTTTPVDAEAHRARVERLLVDHAPLATPKPRVDFSLLARQRAAAERVRAELSKQAELGPSGKLKIGGRTETKTSEGSEAGATKEKKREEREKALRRLRRLDKQPAFPEHVLPQRFVGKQGEKRVRDSDVEFDLQAFAKESSLLVREGRPVIEGRSSFDPRVLDASLDRKMDRLQVDVQTLLEDYRQHLRQTVEAGLAEVHKAAYEKGKAATENIWFDRALFAEAEVGRHRNTINQYENATQVAQQTTFEAQASIKEAKAEIEKAQKAEKAAVEAKEAAKQLAREEVHREVRDELAGLKGKVLVADAVAADSQRRAEEQEKAANEARKEAAEARREKAEAEALAAELKEQVVEAEAKAESATRRADEAERSLSEALAQVTTSDKMLAKVREELKSETEAKLSLQLALDAAKEAAAKEEARRDEASTSEASVRAEEAEKALASIQLRNAELEELAQRLEGSLRKATDLAESQQRGAEAEAARLRVESFNSALAMVEADMPGLDLTDLYLVPDSPDPPVDGE